MIKRLLFIFTGFVTWGLNLGAQCSYTPAIVASDTNVCGGNIVLTAVPPGEDWVQKINFPGISRSQGIGFSIGTKGYAGLGGNRSDLWEYNQVTNAWTQKANFPPGVYDHDRAFTIGSLAYVAAVTGTTEVFYEYNPAGNTWTQKASPGGNARQLAIAFSAGTKGYLGAGLNLAGNVHFADFWEYDPIGNTWTQKADFGGGPRRFAIAFSINGKGYAGMGFDAGSNPQVDLWEYTPGTNTWTPKTNYPGANNNNAVFVVNNKAYVLEASNTATNNFFEYNPGLDTWTAKTPFVGSTHFEVSAFGIGSLGYFGAGMVGHSDFFEYNSAYTYSWSNGATTNSIMVSTTGIYSVTMTDVLSCSARASKAVTVNPIPVVTSTASASSICRGENITLTAGGASTYTWTNGVSNGVPFSPTVSLTYTVTGTAANGCTNTSASSVSVNDTPTVTATASNPVVCMGQTTSLTGGGATSYTWTGGAVNAAIFTPTSTFAYTVTGIDAVTGCTNVAVTTITVNVTPTVTAIASHSVICLNNSVTLSGSGANTYTWTGSVTDGIAFSPTLTTTFTVTGATAANCAHSAVITITVNSLPVVTASVSSAVICNGKTTSLHGGGASTYSWSGGATDGLLFSPGASASYTVTGTGVNGCTNSAVTHVTVNSLPVVTANTTSVAVCAGGSVTLSGSGATTYAWSHGIVNGSPFAPGLTSIYTVTGTDAATGCTNTAVQTISVNSVPTVVANASQSVVCLNTSVTLNGTGATTYTWTGGISDGIAFSPTSTATYTVSGSTAFNCTNTATATVTVNSLPAVTGSVSNTVICNGVSVTFNGGGAISYAWTGGVTNGAPFTPGTTNTYTVTGTDLNACTNTAVVSVSVNPLPPLVLNASHNTICIGSTLVLSGSGATSYTWSHGVISGATFSPGITTSYTLDGTDAATGCTTSVVKTITVNSLPLVTASISDPVICLGDLVTLNGGGASTYIWTDAALDGIAFSPTLTQNYTVTGTDVNSCTNTAVTSVTVNSLPLVTAGISASIVCLGDAVVVTGSGASTYTWTGGVTDGMPFTPGANSSYTVTGMDMNNCFSKAVISVTVNSLPSVTAGASQSVVCFGSTITLNGSGANSYTWTSPVINGAAFAPLLTDNYTVTGSDSNGCSNTATLTVTVNALPIVTANASNSVICLNQTTSLSGGGASAYTWSGGVINGAVFSPTVTDSYTVTGTDANGCTERAVQVIIVNPLPVITANISNPVSCLGDLVTLNGGGGNMYLWTNGVIDGMPFSPGSSGTYTVVGFDINTCSNTAVASLTVKPLPIVGASANPSVICSGDITTLNGSGAASYLWTTGVTDGIAFNPPATDSYTVTGTGVNGCTNIAVVSVTVNALPAVTATASHSVICLNYSTSLSGGGALSYVWSGTVINGTPFTPTVTDTYTVTGTDSKGCKNTAVRSITVNPLPVVTASAVSTAICSGQPVTLSGIGAISYLWSSGISDGVSFTPTVTASYTVSGTDANTCSNTAVITVTVHNTPTITASATNASVCYGDLATLSGGGAISYAWTGGIADGIPFSPAVTGNYTVTGTSVDGCTNTAVASITVNSLPQVTAVVTNTSVCYGSSAVFIGGGANTYTWSNGIINLVGYSPTVTATYTVAGTDLNGCVNTDTVTVVVNPLPVIGASVTQSVICAGEWVTFNGSGASSYTWTGGVTNGVAFSPTSTSGYTLTGSTGSCVTANFVVITVTVHAQPFITAGSGSICTGNTFTISPAGALSYTFSETQVVSPSVTTVYSITGTNAEGCVNSPPVTSTVFVNPLPIVQLASSQNSLCTGSAATIVASGANNFIWNNGNTAAEISVTPTLTTSYSVTGTDQNLCQNTASLLITVAPLPTLNIMSGPPNICRGTEVKLTASGAETYSWSTGDTSPSITKSPQNSINYTLTGTNGDFCTASKTVSFTVNPIPFVDAGPDAEIQSGVVYQFAATQVGAVQFSWASAEGLNNPFVLNPTSSIDHDITYTLTVTSPGGCSAKDEINITVTDGLTIANYMSPNGDGKNDSWKISNLHAIKNCSIEILNGWGKTVFSKNEGYNNDFDAGDLPDGVYYYFIKDGGKLKYKGSITVTR